MSAFGVYFLANDAVAPWAAGMLRSLRIANPATRVIHLPFDDDCDAISALADEHGAESWEGDLGEWDAVGRRFFPDSRTAAHAFRKFAIFDGPLERFFFLDCDVAVIDDLSDYAKRVFDGELDRICFYRRAHAAPNFPDANLQSAIGSMFGSWAPGGFNTALIAYWRDPSFLIM